MLIPLYRERASVAAIYFRESEMAETHATITIFIFLLLIASGVAMATRWIRVPYTLALVIVGLIISPMHFLPAVHISPDLILLIFLPALLFEAAWNLKLESLRENIGPILLLAVLGVCLSVGVVGAVMRFGIDLPWSTALLFGAMISATDPVSVLAIFKKLGLPKRLATIVEGESLLNDGTAVVVFKIVLAIVIGANLDQSSTDVALDSLREFAKVVFGGFAVGAAVGILASALTSRFDDHLLEITLTTIAAYGSFLGAESLHVSPVIAVLVAGLILGNYGREKGMSPTTQVAVNSFWEYAAFVVNSLVFLLIGLEIQLPTLVENATGLVWAILAMIASRIVAVYGLMPLANRFFTAVPFRWQHVLFWGGLRGSLSMALALSLPLPASERSQLVTLIFGAVIFSLLAQGLTVGPLLKWLRLTEKSRGALEYEILHGRLLAETAAMAELDALRNGGLITSRVYDGLKAGIADRCHELNDQMAKLDGAEGAVEIQQQARIRRHLINFKKARISELLHEGILSDNAFAELNSKIDHELADLHGEQMQAHSESHDESQAPQ